MKLTCRGPIVLIRWNSHSVERVCDQAHETRLFWKLRWAGRRRSEEDRLGCQRLYVFILHHVEATIVSIYQSMMKTFGSSNRWQQIWNVFFKRKFSSSPSVQSIWFPPAKKENFTFKHSWKLLVAQLPRDVNIGGCWSATEGTRLRFVKSRKSLS